MDTLRADFPWTALHRFVQRRVRDPHLADDVVQDVAVIAWTKQDQLRDPGAYKAWVFSIARRTVVERIRTRLRERAALRRGAMDPRPPDDPVESAEIHSLVRTALRQLPGRLRQILVLRYWHGMTYRAIGSTLGGSEINVRVLAHRARKALEGPLETTAA